MAEIAERRLTRRAGDRPRAGDLSGADHRRLCDVFEGSISAVGGSAPVRSRTSNVWSATAMSASISARRRSVSALTSALARWGSRLGLEDRADPAALPLAFAILTLFFFLATPLVNSITRQMEAEADAFGLNAAREPNGFAMAAMRLSTYRKIHPGPLEEIVFYDHPSGYDRVHAAMVWLKENQDNPTANAPLPNTPPR